VSDFDARLNRIVRASHREGIFLALTGAVAAGMQSASDAHALTREQALAWNDFLARWKAGYHGAAALWRTAKATHDEPLAEQAAAVLGTLLGQLATWQAVVLKGPS
jgi:hypothetical protein